MPQPDLIVTPFGENAPSNAIDDIPESRSPGDLLEKATWSEGFPGLTMIPLSAGGIPPRGQDFNGVLKAISEHVVFQGGGGQYAWRQEWVDANGGYPAGAVLASNDGMNIYVSTVDNNDVNFNTTPSSIGNQWLLIAGTELSTVVPQAEAETGTATTRRAWTAQRVRQAITSQFATEAEAQALESLTKILTPGRLDDALKGSNQSFGVNGYQIFPGGLIIQWGRVQGVTNSGVTFSFPIAFPNQALQLIATDSTNQGSSFVSISGGAPVSNTEGYGVNDASGGDVVVWLAIGY